MTLSHWDDRKILSMYRFNIKGSGTFVNFEVSEKIGQLKMPSLDGKIRDTDCVDTETLFRIIQRYHKCYHFVSGNGCEAMLRKILCRCS